MKNKLVNYLATGALVVGSMLPLNNRIASAESNQISKIQTAVVSNYQEYNKDRVEKLKSYREVEQEYSQNREEFLKNHSDTINGYRVAYGEFPMDLVGRILWKGKLETQTIPIKFLISYTRYLDEYKKHPNLFSTEIIKGDPNTWFEFVNIGCDLIKIIEHLKDGIINFSNFKENDAAYLGERGFHMRISWFP
jgi:hypothetical protein